MVTDGGTGGTNGAGGIATAGGFRGRESAYGTARTAGGFYKLAI